MSLEFGLYTFGDIVRDVHTGKAPSFAERTAQMLELARLAEQTGLDVIGVGEHHGLRYVNSATATLIAAMAAQTTRIRFTSASTSISTADPVRTFQEFATADLISNGRVEVIFGRGAFTDNFPLFGYELDDYDELFVEKVSLFALLNERERVTWKGRFRPALDNAEISPRPAQAKLPVWIGAGSPQRLIRAAKWKYPVAIPVLGGSLDRYGQLASLYRDAMGQADAPLAVFSHLHVSDEPGLASFFPYYSAYLEPLFKGPMPRAVFDQMKAPDGTLFAGSSEQIAEKLIRLHAATGFTRFLGQIDIGGQPFEVVKKSIERFATEVVPLVKRKLS